MKIKLNLKELVELYHSLLRNIFSTSKSILNNQELFELKDKLEKAIISFNNEEE